MKLPTTLRVGRRLYTVRAPARLTAARINGRTIPTAALMEVATQSMRRRPRSPAEISETFWHELTHAILAEMGSPLYRNEAFVTQFAKHLSTAVQSARFE